MEQGQTVQPAQACGGLGTWFAKACPLPAWARRLGAAAFLFFLIKGLLWLIVPAAVVAWQWWK